ncbi:MAG: hypothetical protein ACKO04_00650 [Actinomycetes bacterium]
MDVAAWLEGLLAPEPDLVELLDEVRADLEATARWCASELPPDAVPLRLPKSRLADLGRCERLALARFERPALDDEMTGARFRGMALDRLVVHQLVAGRLLDPLAELRGALAAEGEWAALDHLDAMDDVEAQAVLWPLVGAVTDAWSAIDPSWVPRTQAPAMLSLADGAVVCSGVLDVELGGPVADRPGAVVEVKSGRPSAAHADEVYLYALVVALRDRTPPSQVARWYPGGGPVGLPVTSAVLETAARRLGDGIEQWASLRAGRPAQERPGWWCRFCPDAADCPSVRSDAPDPDVQDDSELDDELSEGWVLDPADLGDDRGD